MNLLIVSSNKDIEYARKNRGNFLIVSGFTSVANFFKKNKFFCLDLNEYISDKFKVKNYHKLQNEYYNLFKKKDARYVLFRNKYLFNYIGFIYLIITLRKIIKKKKITKIILSDSIKEKLNNDEFLFETLIYILKNFNNNLQIINIFKDTNIIDKENFYNKFKKTIFDLSHDLKIKKNLKENIFLLEKNKLGLKKLKFFLDKDYNTFYFKKVNLLNEVKISQKKINAKNFKKNLRELFKDYFNKFLKINNNVIKNEIRLFFDILKKKKITKIAWLFSPCEANIFPILIHEAFKRKIQVLGFQHGGIYGVLDENNPNNIQHKVNDYNFCNIFYSYSDFRIRKNSLFIKDKKTDVKQLKFFQDYKIKTYEKKILYIPQITNHFFNPKFSFPSNFFYNEQKKISDFLIKELDDSYLTYFKFYNDLSQNFIETYYPIYPYIKDKIDGKKNLRFVKEKSIIDFILKEKPGTIILDYVSTPLWEIIKFPINILILKDNKFYNLNKKFSYILKDKAIFFNNTKNLKKIIKNIKPTRINNNKEINKFIL